MLKVHPNISVNLTTTSEYPITIFMYIDCDAGPMELTQVNSLLDFYIMYQSKRVSESYKLALKLLELGYQLQLIRVNSHDNYPSLMLTNESKLYSYPNKSIKYFNRFSKELDSSYMNINQIRTYGFSIYVPKNGIVAGDYILFNIDKDIWYYINYASNPLVSSNMYQKTFNLNNSYNYTNIDNYNKFISNTGDAHIVAEAITDVIRTRIGLITTDILDNLDGSCTINCYSTELKLTPHTSIGKNNLKILDNAFLNYDVLCQYFTSIKTIEFYSKYSSADSFLNCRIEKLGSIKDNDKEFNMYNIIIEKLSLDGSILYTENYQVDERLGIEYCENLFNINSKLVTCKVTDLHNIPAGSWSFERSIETIEASIQDFINVSNNTAGLQTMSADIIIDSGLTYIDHDFIEGYIIDEVLNKDKIYNYDKFISNLESMSGSSKLLFTSFNPYHNYKYDAVSLSLGKVILDNESYPTYILPLFLLATYKETEGKLNKSVSFSLTDYERYLINKYPKLKIEVPEVTNYELKLINPLCYFLKSEVTIDLCIKTLYTIGAIRRELVAEQFLDEDKVKTIISDVTIKMSEYFNKTLDIITESVDISDRLCVIHLSTELNFNYRKYFDLNININ